MGSNSHFEAKTSENVGQAVSLSGLGQANSLSYDTLTAKMRIVVWMGAFRDEAKEQQEVMSSKRISCYLALIVLPLLASSAILAHAIDANAIIATVAGDGNPGFSGDGGLATESQLNFPTGVALDGEGNLYIADNGNHRIRKVIAATGVITTVAGDGVAGYSGDNGPAVEAQLNLPADVAYAGVDKLYIADQDNNRIRTIAASENLMIFLPIIFKN